MKKIISIFLLVIYATSSFAITVNMHYCGGKYSGLSLANLGRSVQCSCSSHHPEHKGCCSDKTVCAKTDKHPAVQPYYVSPNLSCFTIPVHFINVAEDYPEPVSLNNHYSSPGFVRSHTPSFLTFICTYRI